MPTGGSAWQLQDEQEPEHDRQQQRVHGLDIDGQADHADAGQHEPGTQYVSQDADHVELGVAAVQPLVEAVPPAEHFGDARRPGRRDNQRRHQCSGLFA